ncbi:MAG: TatD family hydrolase [Desulfosarcinaceae bacterium]|nr:TatD family hydrolase [Desulfosarcinaceae bacterium]
MIVDIHTHAFPAVIRDQRERYFPDEPAFKLLYETPNARLVGAAEIVASMDAEAVDLSVVFGFPWSDMDTCRRNNDYILSAVRRYPDRLRGFCCVDPHLSGAADEVERCLAAGLSGVGELAFYRSGLDDACVAALAPVMGLCRAFQVPVMIHTNEPVGHRYPGKTPNTLVQIYRLVKAYPENTLILAHWGGGLFFYQLLKRDVRATLKNVYYDTAASPFLYDPAVYRLAAELVGSDKILFGTDYPLIPPGRYYQEIAASGLDDTQRRQLLGLNAAALLEV